MLDQLNGPGTHLLVPHVIKGETLRDCRVEHRLSAVPDVALTPEIDLDSLIWPRCEPGPAFETPIAEIVDFLAAVGEALNFDRNRYLREAAAQNLRCNNLGARILENCYRDIASFFEREAVEAEAEGALGAVAAVDGWQDRVVRGARVAIRAYPPRVVHVLAGNAPIVPPISIVRAAISKGVHLLKMPSNDLFTATALLRTMADVGPNHPTTRSFSAAYWRGGDAAIESHIYRSQYFDKLIVWGGEAAVRHAMKYAAPGFEIISFDPKVSVSLIGRENHLSVAQRMQQIARNIQRIQWLNENLNVAGAQGVRGKHQVVHIRVPASGLLIRRLGRSRQDMHEVDPERLGVLANLRHLRAKGLAQLGSAGNSERMGAGDYRAIDQYYRRVRRFSHPRQTPQRFCIRKLHFDPIESGCPGRLKPLEDRQLPEQQTDIGRDLEHCQMVLPPRFDRRRYDASAR